MKPHQKLIFLAFHCVKWAVESRERMNQMKSKKKTTAKTWENK